MASPEAPHLEITIISAKKLKNVNWRNGDLKPYATFYLDPDHRLSTRPDLSGSTRPVWNERFDLPLTLPLHESLLTLEIFHCKPSETPKPLVGSLKFPLSKLAESDSPAHVLELLRPSGRPQGKLRLKIVLRDRPSLPPPPPDYHIAPRSSYYYTSAPPPPLAHDYRDYSPSPYSFLEHHHEYYSAPPPLPSRPFFNRASNFTSASDPSAPVELPSSDDQKQRPPPPREYSYEGPSGPSAPVDYSPYDHRYSEGKVADGNASAHIYSNHLSDQIKFKALNS